MTEPRRFLVLGLDGATFDLLDQWFEAGELPFLRGLATRGVRAPLTSVFPPKTIPAWYSFATGADPGALGIYGFTEPDGGPGRSKLVQTYRPAEAFWDLLSRQGRSVGVVNFPLRSGYPLHGFVVPGMLVNHGPTYPDDLGDWLDRELGEPYLPELPPYRDADRDRWVELATRGALQRGHAGELLIRRFAPDFLFVLFRETDRVQHQHWSELDRPPARVPDDLRQFWRAVDQACERLDRAFRAAGGPAVTLVVSDHGHGPARSDFFVNRWLAEEGYLKFHGPPRTLRRRLTPRILNAADRLPGARAVLRYLVGRMRSSRHGETLAGVVAGPSSFESMRERIDWEHTLAYSYPVPEGIYLNPYNPHLTAEEGAHVVAEIRAKLARYDRAHIEVLSPDELYGGPPRRGAPALLLRVDGLATETRMDFSHPTPMLRERPGYFYGTGVHRMDGILLAGGDGITARRLDAPASLLDIAPTVLDGMGVRVPGAMRGRSLVPLLGPSDARAG